MKKTRILSAVLAAALLATSAAAESYVSPQKPAIAAVSAMDAESSRTAISDEFAITSEDGSWSSDGAVYTITAGGEYTLTGALKGHIVVDAGEEKVSLILAGCSVICDTAAPLVVLSADKVSITAQADTFNELTDARPQRGDTEGAELTAENAGAAVYAVCDLTVKGKGTLVVSGGCANGIASKDDLAIKNLTLKVTAAGIALKGNDGVSIEGAQVTAIAETGDGIRSDNSDTGKKGDHKGTVEITDSVVDILACGDGISSAWDVSLKGTGCVTIRTDTYSEYSREPAAKTAGTIYLILPTRYYDSARDYYAYFGSTAAGEGCFVQTGSVLSVYGGRTMYYGLKIDMPAGYDRVAFAACDKGADPESGSFVFSTDGMTINTEANAYLITAISGSTASGDWTSLSTDGTGKNGKQYSTKGLKAENEVTIEGAVTLVVSATDDAIHVNGDSGAGAFTMLGGSLLLRSGDDGIHADNSLTIAGGTLVVESSYEGLEANQVTISGGESFVYASDDGVNACSASDRTTPCVTVTGGYLEVTTPTGDTDAIDSNGNYVQSGGYVVVRGGSTMGSVAGSVDVDGSITVSGGCIAACGGVCESPRGGNAYVSAATTLSAGSYSLTDKNGNELLSFTLDTGYRGFWVACDGLTAGMEYTLFCNGSKVLSWTQESGTMGSSGAGGFGGGFGGSWGGRG